MRRPARRLPARRLAPPLASAAGLMAAAAAVVMAASGCASAPVAAQAPPPLAPVTEVKPAYASVTSGWKRPSELLPGCVERTVVPPPLLQRIPEVTVKFAVAPDGSIDRFEDVSSPPASQPVIDAVRRAVSRCEYVPGRDPKGALASIWLILTVRPLPPR